MGCAGAGMSRTRAWPLPLLFASQLLAQQAILPRKGRQPDRTPPAAEEPLRRLPRPGAGTASRRSFRLSTFGPHVPDAAAIGRSSASLSARFRHAAPSLSTKRGFVFFRRPPVAIAAASVPTPQTQATAIPNRWKIFPAPPWRRYDNDHLDAIYAASQLLGSIQPQHHQGRLPALWPAHLLRFHRLQRDPVEAAPHSRAFGREHCQSRRDRIFRQRRAVRHPSRTSASASISSAAMPASGPSIGNSASRPSSTSITRWRAKTA